MWPVKSFSPSPLLLLLVFIHPSSCTLMLRRRDVKRKGHHLPSPSSLIHLPHLFLVFLWTSLCSITEKGREMPQQHPLPLLLFSFFFFLFFTDNLMCRINAVGHFTQQQVRGVAGWFRWCQFRLSQSDSWQLFGHLDRTAGDISHPKSLESVPCSSATFPFNQCRSDVMRL